MRTNQMRIDGYGAPVDLVAAVRIGETGIDLDFFGTSPKVNVGINVPLTYTQANASFGIRCVVGNSTCCQEYKAQRKSRFASA